MGVNMAKRYADIAAMGDDYYDVGIIGVWYGENYGSTLTYYALQKVIRDMGYSTIMLDKRPSKDDPELEESIHSRVFAEEHYEAIAPRLELGDLHLLNSHCGAYIIGCDQVWNYGISRGFGRSFYLDFAGDENKKLSYASSFGHAKSFTPMEALPEITKLFHRFDAVSVRESDAVRILMEEFGIEGTQVLDPVFLIDKADFEKLASRCKPHPKKYILAYILDPTEEIGSAIRSYAEKRGLDLVVLLDARGDKRGSTEKLEQGRKTLGVPSAIRCSDAYQWLRYILDAEYVITDSFHGASFSLILEKQFALIANKQRGVSRSESLANLFQFRGNLVPDPKDLAFYLKKNLPVDYARVNAIKECEKQRSLDWLATNLARKHEVAKNITQVTKKECCGCGSCYNACGFDAIRMVPDDEGFLYPLIDASACVDCGRCKIACPALNPDKSHWKVPVTFAGYTGEDVRERSSSGGLFSLFAEEVISQGGVVFGAAFDEDFHLAHVAASTEEELGPLRMSKYLQSDAGLTYREAKQHLDEGKRVLYVGCPCQIAGLNSFLGKEYDNLLTIDLLCHGGPSQKVFKRYLEDYYRDKDIEYVGFRDKDEFGWSTEMTVKFKDGGVHRALRSEDPFYRSFLPCLSTRPHCQVCHYSTLPRQGDVTLGDFWGVSRYVPEYSDGRGTSIISANSRKGLAAVESIEHRLAVFGGINLQYILDHGQPFAKPFRNNPMRSRFHRTVADTTIEKALECCEKNIFDFAILGLRANSIPDIITSYALYKVVAAENHSVLEVRYPADLQQGPMPMMHELARFANAYYPCVSTQDVTEKLHRLNAVARGFLSETSLEKSATNFIEGDRKVLNCSSILKINPVYLLDAGILEKMGAEGHMAEPEAALGVYMSGGREVSTNELDAVAGQLGGSWLDLTQVGRTEDFLASLQNMSLVVTDDTKCFAVSVAMNKPVLLAQARDTGSASLEALGLDAYVLRQGESLGAACGKIVGSAPQDALRREAVEEARARLASALPGYIGTPVKRASDKSAPAKATDGVQIIKKRPAVVRGVRYMKKHGLRRALIKALEEK